jgi:hypothetical protein
MAIPRNTIDNEIFPRDRINREISGPVGPSGTGMGGNYRPMPAGNTVVAKDQFGNQLFSGGGNRWMPAAQPRQQDRAAAIGMLSQLGIGDGSTMLDPLTALKAYFAGLDESGGNGSDANSAAMRKYYGDVFGALDQQTNTTNAAFDQRKQAIADLLAQSGTRLTGILGDLGTQTQAAGAATSQAYTDAQARQAALQQEFAASEAARAAGQAQTLGAFGVAPTGIERQYAPAQMVEAQRAALAQQQAADAALYANRGAVQAGLSSDVSTRNSQQAAILQAQLDYQRQIAAQQAAQQRAQLAMQAAQQGVSF